MNIGPPMMSPHGQFPPHGGGGGPGGFQGVRSPRPPMRSPAYHHGSPGHPMAGMMSPHHHPVHSPHMMPGSGGPSSHPHPGMHSPHPIGPQHHPNMPMHQQHQMFPHSQSHQQTHLNQSGEQHQHSGQGGSSGGNDRESAQVSAMPLPPMQYVERYSDQAVTKNLAPLPPPPIKDAYTMFGNIFSAEDHVIQSLDSQGFRRLYSNKDLDRKKELHKLNHSILVNFLDLLDILIKCSNSDSRRIEKIEDINLIFINMHHLINEFRPHQARETLKVMLQMQVRKRLQMVERFQKNLDEVQDSIENAIQALPTTEEVEQKYDINSALQ